MSDDDYRYSDPGTGYLLMIKPPWTATAVSLHPLLSEAAAAARRRFVRAATATLAEGATIIEVSISKNAPWCSPTGRMWWLGSDPCCGIRECSAWAPIEDPISERSGRSPRGTD